MRTAMQAPRHASRQALRAPAAALQHRAPRPSCLRINLTLAAFPTHRPSSACPSTPIKFCLLNGKHDKPCSNACINSDLSVALVLTRDGSFSRSALALTIRVRTYPSRGAPQHHSLQLINDVRLMWHLRSAGSTVFEVLSPARWRRMRAALTSTPQVRRQPAPRLPQRHPLQSKRPSTPFGRHARTASSTASGTSWTPIRASSIRCTLLLGPLLP